MSEKQMKWFDCPALIKVRDGTDDDKPKQKPEDEKPKVKPDDEDPKVKPGEDDDKQRLKPYEKQDGEPAIVEGYITTYGNEDVVGDVIQQGALDDFIADFNAGEVMLRMLFQHDRAAIIGQWTELRSDEFGVYAVGEIFTDVSLGADIATLIRRGVLNSFSIGFMFDENGFEMRRDGGRLFTEISLVETSVVDVPANPQARITNIKRDDNSLDLKKLEKLLRDAGLSRTESKTAVSNIDANLRDAESKNEKQDLYSKLLSKLNEV